MKLVHTADWHIGKSLNDYSLVADQKYYFNEFIKKLDEIKPDILIIAGDLYDRSIPTIEATRLLNSILNEIVNTLHIKVFAIAGNHDSKDRLSFGSELLEKSGFYIAGSSPLEIKQVPITIGNESANICLLPYFEPHHIKPLFPDEQIKTHDQAMKLYTADMLKSLDKSKINILVGHGLYGKSDSEEITVGGSEMIDASIFCDFDYVALGHLHSFRTAGSEKFVFSGSPLKYSIDETSHEVGFCVVELTKESMKLERVLTRPLHDVKVLEGSFDFFLSPLKETDEDYIFVNLTDKAVAVNAISRLKAVFPNILGLKYINLMANTENPDSSFIKPNKNKSAISTLSTVDLFSDFYEAVTQEKLTEEQHKYLNSIDIN